MFLRDIRSCIFQCIYTNKIGLARKILDCGFDINSLDYYNRTPIMVAHMLHRDDFIQLFLDYNADTTICDHRGNGVKYYIELLRPHK